MAGVVDLEPGGTGTVAADLRAAQFLAANGWPTNTMSLFDSARSFTVSGIPQYSLTATWPVDLFFAKVIGLDSLPITHAASAAFYAQSELYTPTAHDEGQIRKAPQFIFGSKACTAQGDPVSPVQSTLGVPNTDYTQFDGLYRYRIRIPETYTETHVRVELFDPDDYNLRADNATVTHTDAVSGTLPTALTCSGATNGMGDRCIIDTQESLINVFQNPFWLQRVDENWDTSCNQVNSSGNGNGTTEFELYYFNASGEQVSLAAYIADGSHYADTDLHWVSPGVSGTVPYVPADSGSFEVSIGPLPADDDGTKTIELDVRSNGGSSKNVWDIWAGPPPSYYAALGLPGLESDANLRNVQIANSPGAYATQEVEVVALGRMPLEHYASSELTFELAPLDISSGDGTIYATLFGSNNGASAPKFQIDSVSQAEFYMCTTVVVTPTMGMSGHCGIPEPLEATCDDSTDCGNSWMMPQYAMGIPGEATGFSGGTLLAIYNPATDAHTWWVAVTAGRPFLTR